MPKQLPKVWVVQENNNDYSSAEIYGEICFISNVELRPYDCEANVHVAHDIRGFLANYIPGTDLIIPAGNPMNIALVLMSLPQKQKHNLLKWDGRKAAYIPYTLTTDAVN